MKKRMSKAEVITAALNESFKMLSIAHASLASGNVDSGKLFVKQARQIIAKLDEQLDLKHGGTVAATLHGIFSYVLSHTSSSPAKVEDVGVCARMISEMAETYTLGLEAIHAEKTSSANR